VRPNLKSSDSYKNFETIELNNARLLTYRLYFEKLDDFEAVFKKLGDNFSAMLKYCKSLESSKDPKADLAHEASMNNH
jgi:predicted aminopeptidase